MNPTLAWWFEPADGCLGYGDGRTPVAGETHTVDCEPVLCSRGLHASVSPLDALGYAYSGYVWRVEIDGDVERGDDKIVGRSRKYLFRVDADRILHVFAIWCAEQALALIDEPDPRSVEALRVKRAWLAGEATDEGLAAAGAAARAAAGDAQSAELERLLLATVEAEVKP